MNDEHAYVITARIECLIAHDPDLGVAWAALSPSTRERVRTGMVALLAEEDRTFGLWLDEGTWQCRCAGASRINLAHGADCKTCQTYRPRERPAPTARR